MPDWFEFTDYDIELLEDAVTMVRAVFAAQTANVVSVLNEVLKDVPAPLHQIAIDEAVMNWLDDVEVDVEFTRLAQGFGA